MFGTVCPSVRTDIEGLRNLKSFSMQKMSQSNVACSQLDDGRASQPVGVALSSVRTFFVGSGLNRPSWDPLLSFRQT